MENTKRKHGKGIGHANKGVHAKGGAVAPRLVRPRRSKSNYRVEPTFTPEPVVEPSMIVGGQDRIGSLPADLRAEILALLPLKEAARTSCVSSTMNHAFKLTMEEGEVEFTRAFGEDLHSTSAVHLNHLSMRYLGYKFHQGKLPLPSESFDNLKGLTMELCCKCPLQKAASRCLFLNARNIEMLEIWCPDEIPELTEPGSYGWLEQCSFPLLQTIKLVNFHTRSDQVSIAINLISITPSLVVMEFVDFKIGRIPFYKEIIAAWLKSFTPTAKLIMNNEHITKTDILYPYPGLQNLQIRV